MSRGEYPATRMRRNRMKAFSRRLMAESRLSVDDLIWPMFVIEGTDSAEPVEAMPGVERLTVDRLVAQAREAMALGIPAIAIFPSIDASLKDEDGTLATDGDNLVCRTVRAVKEACPDLGVICDVALDPYTSHGHDGVLRDGQIANDETVAILCRQAVRQADAGCDIIAPSDMMDGRVGESAARSTRRAIPASRSCPTPRNTPRAFTARSEAPSAPAAPPERTANRPTRWTRRTATRRFMKSRSTFRRAPTW